MTEPLTGIERDYLEFMGAMVGAKSLGHISEAEYDEARRIVFALKDTQDRIGAVLTACVETMMIKGYSEETRRLASKILDILKTAESV